MKDKLGPYINKLMATIVENESNEFTKELAWSELKRLNQNVEEFLRKHLDTKEEQEKTEKQLLQEEK